MIRQTEKSKNIEIGFEPMPIRINPQKIQRHGCAKVEALPLNADEENRENNRRALDAIMP
jgi:hypothetical protein